MLDSTTSNEAEQRAPARTDALNRLVERMNEQIDAMVDETDAAFRRQHPEVAARVDSAVRRRMIEPTFRRVLHALQGQTPLAEEAELHVAFGAMAARAGVPLKDMLAGYRLGAGIGWQRIRKLVDELGLDRDVVLELADVQVSYLDELVANSVEGFDREADRVRGQRVRERQALLDAVLAGTATRGAASDAAWTWSDVVVVAVLRDPVAADPDPRVLLGTADATLVAVAEPAALDRWLHRTQATAAVGPTVALDRAATSLDRARRVSTLGDVGLAADTGVTRWEQVLATLVVHADPVAATALAHQRLGPLHHGTKGHERLLLETLGAWLDHPGRPQAMARALHLHVQTVHYRLARLRERLGDELDDPQARFEFALALRYRAADSAP